MDNSVGSSWILSLYTFALGALSVKNGYSFGSTDSEVKLLNNLNTKTSNIGRFQKAPLTQQYGDKVSSIQTYVTGKDGAGNPVYGALVIAQYAYNYCNELLVTLQGTGLHPYSVWGYSKYFWTDPVPFGPNLPANPNLQALVFWGRYVPIDGKCMPTRNRPSDLFH